MKYRFCTLHTGNVQNFSFPNVAYMENYVTQYSLTFDKAPKKYKTALEFFADVEANNKTAWRYLREYIAFCRQIQESKKTGAASLKLLTYGQVKDYVGANLSSFKDVKFEYGVAVKMGAKAFF